MDELDEPRRLRQYLLGTLGDESVQAEIEERLMVDEEFAARVAVFEEELIEEFLDGELSADESSHFSRFFLAPPERKRQLRLTRDLRRVSASQTNVPHQLRSRADRSHSTAWLRYAFAVAVIVIAGAGIWWFSSTRESDDGLLALYRAYSSERPLQSRISAFSHAPFYNVRSDRRENIDFNGRDRAELILRDKAFRDPSASNLHALGKLLLAKKQFDQAIAELEQARRLASSDASIQNDLGVAYLEKYKSQGDGGDTALARKALDYIEESIRLDSSDLEALYNRALALELLGLQSEAMAAWRDYLQLDATSPWADEARERLQQLQKQTGKELSADELDQEFLLAFAEKDDQTAFELASRNREMIHDKYLPVRLTRLIASEPSADRRTQLTASLRFLGEVEKARFGDNLALDLAEIYDGASAERLRTFSDAHARVRNGYQLCLMGKYTAAAAEFQSAQHLFLRASNPAEAEVICAYFQAYCLYVRRDYAGAQVLLKNVDSFATAKGYRWSQLMNYYWLLGAEQSVEHKSLTEIRLEYEAELKKAEEMGDAHMIQKFLLALITKSSFAHLQDRSARYVHRLLTYCARPGLSVRQKARNYEVIIQVTDADQFPAFAKALVRENVKNSESIKDDPAFELSAEVSAGIVNTQTGDFDAAESWFRRAREKAELLPDETPRRENVGNILLNLGNLERGRKNYRRAMDYYDESLRTTENLALPLMHYEITKARLMSFEALDDDASIEREVPAAIGLAESYRRTLLEEQERNGFFESEDEVYDVAIRHELRNNRFENAYNYAEASSSRSLLDLIEKRSNSNHLASDGVYFDGSTTPVLINEIRESIPPNVQVVQFRILRGETIIWVISRHEFQTFVSTISAVDLKAKVDDYMRLVQNKDSAAQDSAREIAHELYTILIGPVRASLKGESYLCIIPNRFLYNLPFASLASADGKYLIEEFALLYSPSANVFIRCSKNADLKSEKQPERVLSVGDPSFDRQQYPDLSRLPEASEEAQMIAADYSSRVVLKGPAATAEAFKSSYKEFEVIHVAAHYVVDSRDPYSSKLIMARAGQDAGFVRHADLMQGQLERAKLVVLSACQSGVENYYAGEGPVGLSRTFLAIGVPLVVASAWSVDSAATNRLMQRFHSLRTKEKLTTVESLREAQLSLIRDADSPYRQPYFWAAFAAHGGAASF